MYIHTTYTRQVTIMIPLVIISPEGLTLQSAKKTSQSLTGRYVLKEKINVLRNALTHFQDTCKVNVILNIYQLILHAQVHLFEC